MRAITYRNAKQKSDQHLQRVVDDLDQTVITRHQKPPAVLISLREYLLLQRKTKNRAHA